MNTEKTLEEQYKNLKLEESILKEKITEVKTQLVLEFIEHPEHQYDGLTVYKSAGKRTTSWKSVAEVLKPSNALVDKFTKIGEPSYGIKMKEPKE